jgi:hypothetical protein
MPAAMFISTRLAASMEEFEQNRLELLARSLGAP